MADVNIKLTLAEETPALEATLTEDAEALALDYGEIIIVSPGRLEDVEVTPRTQDILVSPSPGYNGLASVLVKAIPNNYGLVTYNGITLTIT